MLTKLVERHLLLGSCALLKIVCLDWHIGRACVIKWLRSIVGQVLLLKGTNGLTIESRLMLLLERIDVREQRRNDILLLLMIGGKSRLSRNVLDRLSDIRLHIANT